jgi:hypothetical protein
MSPATRPRRSAALRLASLALLTAVAACSNGGAKAGGSGDETDLFFGPGHDGGAPDLSPGAGPDLSSGLAIDAPANTWTWVDFPDAVCDDGTPTGLGVNPTSGGNLLVFLNGGGACWDPTTCLMLNTAAHGPYGRSQFDAAGAQRTGTILDRDLASNPFHDWSLVFIPYCTGDFHAGDNVVNYSSAGQSHAYHHEGRANVTAYVRRLAATFPSTTKIVVAGSDAGGFGAALDYDLFRGAFPQAKGYLLDDGGPLFKGTSIPTSYFSAWTANWRFDEAIAACTGCTDDLSALFTSLAGRFPSDRFALLSSTQDQVIRSLFLLSPPGFQDALAVLQSDVLRPLTNDHVFFETGTFHTMLGMPASHTTGGVALLTWIAQEVADDPAWTSIYP